MKKLLPLLLLALVGCQQVDKREVCARHSAGLIGPDDAGAALGLWEEDADHDPRYVKRWPVESYCEFYK